MAIGNMHKNLVKITRGSGDICTVNGEENPLPAICDAAYHKRAGGGSSHGHRQQAQKIW